MNILKYKQAYTLLEILIVVAIIALLTVIAIPNILRVRMIANDALAQVTLRTISTAAESYSSANNGQFPADPAALTVPTPPFLNVNYCTTEPFAGSTNDCSAMSSTGYFLIAKPISMGLTGSTNYTMTTGGVLSAGGNY